MKHFDLIGRIPLLRKYNPGQPRVPAGSPAGGQWAASGAAYGMPGGGGGGGGGPTRIRLQGFGSKTADPEEQKKVRAAVDEIMSGGHISPIANNLTVYETGDGLVRVKAVPKRGYVHLQEVSVVGGETRRGYGTQAMRRITAAADKHGATIKLLASPLEVEGGGPKIPQSKLMEFYGRFGFQQEGRGHYMTRPPKVEKYDPAQPRVPSGSPAGGQWTSGSGFGAGGGGAGLAYDPEFDHPGGPYKKMGGYADAGEIEYKSAKEADDDLRKTYGIEIRTRGFPLRMHGYDSLDNGDVRKMGFIAAAAKDINSRFPGITRGLKVDLNDPSDSFPYKDYLGMARKGTLYIKNPLYMEWLVKGQNWRRATSKGKIPPTVVSGSPFSTTFRHELGHVLDQRNDYAYSQALKSLSMRFRGGAPLTFDGRAYASHYVSGYAGSNYREAFAEMFSVFTGPTYKRGDFPRQIETWMDAAVKTATVNKIELWKYDPAQPRVPAGSPAGGQWTSGGAGAVSMGLATMGGAWYERNTGKKEIDEEDAKTITKVAADATGAEIKGRYYGEGGWTNPETGKYEGEPSSVINVEGTPSQIRAFAAAAGYLGGQYSMLTVRPSNESEGTDVAIRLVAIGGGMSEPELYSIARSVDPKRFGGFSALKTKAGTGIEIITEKGSKSNVAAIHAAVSKLKSSHGKKIAIDARFVRAEFVTGGEDGSGYLGAFRGSGPKASTSGFVRDLESRALAALHVEKVAGERLRLWAAPGPVSLWKYNPAQPRVPAGSPAGGQWTSGGGAGGFGWAALAEPGHPRYTISGAGDWEKSDDPDEVLRREGEIRMVADTIEEDFGCTIDMGEWMDPSMGHSRTQAEKAQALSDLGGALAEINMRAEQMGLDPINLSEIKYSLLKPTAFIPVSQVGQAIANGTTGLFSFERGGTITFPDIKSYGEERMQMLRDSTAEVRDKFGFALGPNVQWLAGHEMTVQSAVRAAIRHETGHALDLKFSDPYGSFGRYSAYFRDQSHIANNPHFKTDYVRQNVSVYAATQWVEVWSESFSKVTSPKYKPGSLAPEYEKAVKVALKYGGEKDLWNESTRQWMSASEELTR